MGPSVICKIPYKTFLGSPRDVLYMLPNESIPFGHCQASPFGAILDLRSVVCAPVSCKAVCDEARRMPSPFVLPSLTFGVFHFRRFVRQERHPERLPQTPKGFAKMWKQNHNLWNEWMSSPENKGNPESWKQAGEAMEEAKQWSHPTVLGTKLWF